MLLLGLTGGIATGKSSVSRVLAASPYNFPIIDADIIAREVVAPGTPAYRQILQVFHSSTPDLLETNTSASDSAEDQPQCERPLNRLALGRRVFGKGKEADRQKLNQIVHPAVRKEICWRILAAYLKGHWLVVLDVPLLFESGWEPLCGLIVVVAVHDSELQIERLCTRDPHLSEQDARDRIRSQWDIGDKVQRCIARGPGAGIVLWNDGSKDDLNDAIERVVDDVQRISPKWWARLQLLCPPVAVGAALLSYYRTTTLRRRDAPKGD